MKYDAIVIGSGQGGNPLSHRLHDQGWRVALVERKNLGGTCINTGCTPTKMMVHRAQVAHYARHAAKWGTTTNGVQVNLAEIVAKKNELVKSFRSGQEGHVARRERLDLYRGHARFVDAKRISVGEQIIEGERIFINTGTRALVPQIEGLESAGFLTNRSIMELQEVPEHLVVLGGGYIGLEFGQMFLRFGSRVTVVHHGEQLLPREDADVAAELQKALEAEGMRFLMKGKTTQVVKADGQVALTVERPSGGEMVYGSHLLVATGRTPNSGDLGLEKAGVETGKGGFIKVNHKLETNVPGIWALGDVKGGPAFTHISYNDYQIIFENLIKDGNWTTDNRPVPYSVFTDPQLGGVGMTEKEARASGRKIKVGKIPMTYVARAIERDETAGLMKVIVDAETNKMLGASMLCSEGGELIQILGFLMLAGVPYTHLKGAVYIHPTLAEGFFSLMESVTEVQ